MAPARGACQCGTRATGIRWCGLRHHGIGCPYTDTPLTTAPRRPAGADLVHVCHRCNARARWWHTPPHQRPRPLDGGIIGRVILAPDGSRTPLGRRPPYLAR